MGDDDLEISYEEENFIDATLNELLSNGTSLYGKLQDVFAMTKADINVPPVPMRNIKNGVTTFDASTSITIPASNKGGWGSMKAHPRLPKSTLDDGTDIKALMEATLVLEKISRGESKVVEPIAREVTTKAGILPISGVPLLHRKVAKYVENTFTVAPEDAGDNIVGVLSLDGTKRVLEYEFGQVSNTVNDVDGEYADLLHHLVHKRVGITDDRETGVFISTHEATYDKYAHVSNEIERAWLGVTDQDAYSTYLERDYKRLGQSYISKRELVVALVDGDVPQWMNIDGEYGHQYMLSQTDMSQFKVSRRYRESTATALGHVYRSETISLITMQSSGAIDISINTRTISDEFPLTKNVAERIHAMPNASLKRSTGEVNVYQIYDEGKTLIEIVAQVYSWIAGLPNVPELPYALVRLNGDSVVTSRTCSVREIAK